jgi:hypothetical protein
MSNFQPFTFLQIADLFIDSTIIDALEIAGASRRKRRRESLDNCLKALREAKIRGVDAVFIVGNFWQTESVTQQSVATLQESLCQLDNIPVYITPATYDRICIDSPYDVRFLKARGIKPWSANVHIFGKEEFSTISHPLRTEITITGHTQATTNSNVLTSLNTALEKLDVSCLKLATLPDPLSSIVNEKQTEQNHLHFNQIKTTDTNFLNLRSDYIALGSESSYAEVIDAEGKLRAAQSGALTAQLPAHLGKRYAIFGQITTKPDGGFDCQLEPVEFDNRRIFSLNFDISGMNLPEAAKEILQLLEEEGARKEIDMLIIELEGNYHLRQEPYLLRKILEDSFFHTVIIDKMRPNYLSETFQANSPEDRFVKALLARQTNTGEQVEDALYYGLDALIQKKVILRDLH